MERETKPNQYLVRVEGNFDGRTIEYRPYAWSAADAKFQVESVIQGHGAPDYPARVSYVGPLNPDCKHAPGQCNCGLMRQF